MTKPFHLMTPAERTALRIAQNRAIAERVGEAKTTKPPSKSSSATPTSAGYTRATPEEHAKVGGLIRKVR